MSTTKNPLIIKALLALVCVHLQACAPVLKAQHVDLEVPEAYQQHPKAPENTSELAWESFFADPHLAALIDTALQNNQEVKIAMQDIHIASNEVYARIGEYYPFVTFKAESGISKQSDYTRETIGEGLPGSEGEAEASEPASEGEGGSSRASSAGMRTIGKQTYDILQGRAAPLAPLLPNSMIGVAASWELDAWKKLRNAKDVAVYEYMATMEGRKLIITNLVAEIAMSYYELLALDNKLANLEQNIAIQQEVLGIIRMLKEAARSNELAVKRFEAEVQKNQSEIYAIKQEIIETENRLNFLMGRQPQHIERSAGQFTALNPASVAAGLPSQLMNNRPDIKRAELELAAADLNIQVAQAKFYPSFSMNASLGYEAFNPIYLVRTPQSLTYSLSVDMTAPLINKNAITAEYQTANARQIQAVYEYERTILNAYREVSNQLASIDNLSKNYQLKHQQVETLTQSIDISRKLFQFARADYMEVLLTQRDAVEARMELIETKLAQLGAMVSLYKALGGGWRGKHTGQTPDQRLTGSEQPNFVPDQGSGGFVPQLEPEHSLPKSVPLEVRSVPDPLPPNPRPEPEQPAATPSPQTTPQP